VPRHHIEISLPTKPLKNVDTTISIWSDNEKLGELRVSRGTLDWKSARRKSVKRFSWERLAEMLDEAPGR
jgi:CRISPR/Cas system-associated protein Csm6